MPRPPSDKRARLVRAATTLALVRGFERTSIADIAESAGVPTGSVYYYFKTKDDVARAIIESFREQLDLLIDEWEQQTEPRERLLAYIQNSVNGASLYASHGSAVAMLSNDLRRYSDELGAEVAAVMQLELDWAAHQFGQLGFAPDAASARAMHLVAGLEGGAALSHVLADTAPITREAAHLRRWVENTKQQ